MLLRVLAIFNELVDGDAALRDVADVVRASVGATVVRVWLRDGSEAQLEATRSVSVAPLVASPTSAGAGEAPNVVTRALTTAGVIRETVADGGSRGDTTRVRGPLVATAVPIRDHGRVNGVLLVHGHPAERMTAEMLASLELVAHHIGRFSARMRSEGELETSVREMAELASTDPLTGLKNRREFDHAVRTIPREAFAVISVDVDGLKLMNDEHGHAAGDALLRMVGNTLGLIVRGWDVIARVGGDEFAALLPGIGPFGAALVADRMRLAVHELSPTVGAARITVGWSSASAGADPVSVWHTADECLYEAKHSGGDAVVGRPHGSREARDIADRSYTDVVARVLEGGMVHTVFQPIVDLRTGAVVGFEALARPEGFAPLDVVTPVFEAARTGGQIADVDRLCRKRALEDARALPATVPLFLNVSVASLLDAFHGVDDLLMLPQSVGREPTCVVLEVSEHEQVRDHRVLERAMETYRAEGVRFSLDDVGEGHATREFLDSSEAQFLKLGRSITTTSARAGSRRALETLTALATDRGAALIAKGVENEFVAELMTAAGIRLGQGFGIGKPTLADDIEDAGTALAGRVALRGLRPRRRAVAAT